MSSSTYCCGQEALGPIGSQSCVHDKQGVMSFDNLVPASNTSGDSGESEAKNI